MRLRACFFLRWHYCNTKWMVSWGTFPSGNVLRTSVVSPGLQHTPLNAPGIYIRTLIPDGPAASDGRLRIGDRILAVNGTSLIGADYQRYDPQRSAGSWPQVPAWRQKNTDSLKIHSEQFFHATDRSHRSLLFSHHPLCLCWAPSNWTLLSLALSLLPACHSAVDLIRLGGGRLRFLVAKSDLDVSEKISASSCWPAVTPGPPSLQLQT